MYFTLYPYTTLVTDVKVKRGFRRLCLGANRAFAGIRSAKLLIVAEH